MVVIAVCSSNDRTFYVHEHAPNLPLIRLSGEMMNASERQLQFTN